MNALSAREPGSILDGKYEIVQRLGSGGMGEVYLVRHVHLQELRVIKILRQDLAANPDAQKRFMREARLATQIKHPNVAILYDFATLQDNSFYMVWEHIHGQDVGDRIRHTGPYPVPVAIHLGIQALHGLDAIHASGVIHRDISPDNLMINEDKSGQLRLKIIDLGLARTLEADANYEITQVGMFMGKLQYCSPEQAGVPAGASLDNRSDLYSFALVLYEMIAGRPPFDSDNPHGFVFKRLSEDPLPLKGRNPRVEVPAELDRVMRRALERDREARYPDARSFIAALEKVEQGLAAAQTREIPVMGGHSPAPSEPAPAPPPAAPPRQRSSSELSRAEKIDLLAQIERAAKRVQETSPDLSKAEAALSAGRFDEAEAMIAQIEAASPRASGLDRLKQRMAEAQEKVALRHRVAETEQVLTNYLQKKQLPLARLALETLLELAPAHPKRADYESWIGRLGDESEKDKRAQTALVAGREALARQDWKAARRELDAVVQNDSSGKRAEALGRELEEAEQGVRQSEEVDRRKHRFEELVTALRVVEAEEELAALSRLSVPRVTLDFLRERLAQARASIRQEEQAAVFERRYREGVEARNWLAAREAVHELGKAVPQSARPASMLAEIDRLEAEHRKQQALEQGVRQVELFVEQGDAPKAELALKILLQMDPDNRHRKRLEKQVREMQRR
ncbi:MAG TPA: protein kinase [Thermoanaerobaculia bacterium]|nr:protein kinase [Thermoanaerobaculia bacterium]